MPHSEMEDWQYGFFTNWQARENQFLFSNYHFEPMKLLSRSFWLILIKRLYTVFMLQHKTEHNEIAEICRFFRWLFIDRKQFENSRIYVIHNNLIRLQHIIPWFICFANNFTCTCIVFPCTDGQVVLWAMVRRCESVM